MPIPINIAVEDNLSEAVVRKLLNESGNNYVVKTRFPTSSRTYEKVEPTGYGYIKKSAKAFNLSAAVTPIFILVDLDDNPCVAEISAGWLGEPMHPNCLFRVAVKEVEAWLLADAKSMADFLGLPEKLMPKRVERLNDPKATITKLARKSHIPDVVEGIAPVPGSFAGVGPYYQRMMINYVRGCWDISSAANNCESLSRAVARIRAFTPV